MIVSNVLKIQPFQICNKSGMHWTKFVSCILRSQQSGTGSLQPLYNCANIIYTELSCCIVIHVPFLLKDNSSVLLVSCEKRNTPHSARRLNTASLLSPSSVLYSLLSILHSPPFSFCLFTSYTPAIFHLNILSSCLAASAACQVSSRSVGPDIKVEHGSHL